MSNYEREYVLDRFRMWDGLSLTIVNDDLDGTFRFVTPCGEYHVEVFFHDGRSTKDKEVWELSHAEVMQADGDGDVTTTHYDYNDVCGEEDFVALWTTPTNHRRDLTPDGAQLLVERYRRTEEEYTEWRNELYGSWLARHGLDIATVDEELEAQALRQTSLVEKHRYAVIQIHMMEA